MTTDQLPPGPELDRRCAEAMGWRYETFDPFASFPQTSGGAKFWSCRLEGGGSEHFDEKCLPRLSTDPACQREMLAWLLPKGRVEILSQDRDRWSAALIYTGNETFDDQTGTTIGHALALLVCAVAEREAKR